MRPLRYSINVTLDGCCDHREAIPDEDLHRHAARNVEQADALLFVRVRYEMMEAAWPGRLDGNPAGLDARLDGAPRPDDRRGEEVRRVGHAGAGRLERRSRVRGSGAAVQRLKREPGQGLFTGEVKLPQALAELGLIDEYELVVHPGLAGHGPTLFAGLSKRVALKLVSRGELSSGAVALRYEPRR